MRIQRWGFKLGVATFAVVACAMTLVGAEPVEQVTGAVTDADGRPIEGVNIEVCGEERKLADGTWDRNHTPHCLMSKATVEKGGRFKVAFYRPDLRLNLWIEKEGFAPAYVAGLMPQPQEFKVVMKQGVQVSGHVNRLVNGKLEPVKGATVFLGCSSGDLAHWKQVFDDPYFFVMKMKEGDDLPYLQSDATGSFGEYVFQVTPPPKGKQWFLVCLEEIVPLEVKEGQPVKGSDFVVEVKAREKREANDLGTAER